MSCYGSFGPISIGDCGPKSEIKVDTTSVTKNISNSIQQSVVSQSSKTIAVQNQNVSLTGNCCKPFVVKQGLSINQVDSSKFKGDFATKTGKSMADAINNAVEQSASQVVGLLGATNGPKLTSAIKQAVSKVSQSDSFKNSIQSKMSETFGSQNQNININCGSGDIATPPPPPGQINPETGKAIPDQGCYIDQSFVFNQVTNNLMETLMSDVAEDSQLTQVVNEVKQTSKSKGSGLEDLAAAFTGPMMWVAIAVVVGLVLIVPLVIFAFRVKSKRRYYF